ncbi:hypothetical protein IFR04_012301 [Cadophora malorum]|uniref:Uncharacterized protein n=1 Tax=Cadophora malorum TaxID=108018 RepID=A0A8H7W6W9_9HELO|nr:hypothetical protein IFR04_012301 [Cadophora malorum]
MDGSKKYEDPNQGRQSRYSSTRKQGSSRKPKTPMPSMKPPSYTFQVNGSGQQINTYYRQEAGQTQATVHGSTSMDSQSGYGATRPEPPPAYMGAPVSDASFLSPPQQYGRPLLATLVRTLTYPPQAFSYQGYTQSSFGDVDYSGRDTLLPDKYNVNQQTNAPQNPPFPNSSATISPPAVPQPISARNPTPPPGYMFGSPADLQAAVETDSHRVYNYIRKLNRDNVRLQETLGRSKQQTKDEEDRDKRHVAVMERAWDNLSAALVQVNPALGNVSGPAAQGRGGAQVAQAGVPPPARGRDNTRGRGTGRGRGAGRGRVIHHDDAVGQELPAAPRRSTRRNIRNDNAAGNKRAGDKDGADNDGEDDDDI